jgi:intein-encoded DNA endonuclease-like protein
MKKKSVYGGIVGHTNELEISKYVKESKDNGCSYRDIAKEIKSKFKIAPSHTTVSKYAKDVLKYVEPSQDMEIAEPMPIEINPDRIKEIRTVLGNGDWDTSNENPTKDIYAKVLALAEQNVDDHIATGARLKIEYVKYLYDLKRLLKGGVW